MHKFNHKYGRPFCVCIYKLLINPAVNSEGKDLEVAQQANNYGAGIKT